MCAFLPQGSNSWRCGHISKQLPLVMGSNDDGQHFMVKIRRKSKLAFCLAIFYNMQYAIPIDEQFG